MDTPRQANHEGRELAVKPIAQPNCGESFLALLQEYGWQIELGVFAVWSATRAIKKYRAKKKNN